MRVESNLLMDTSDCSFCHKPLEVVTNVSTPWCSDEVMTRGYYIIGAPKDAPSSEKQDLCEDCAESWRETYERQAKERAEDCGLQLALQAYKDGE